jgi:hypothetical protein
MLTSMARSDFFMEMTIPVSVSDVKAGLGIDFQ